MFLETEIIPEKNMKYSLEQISNIIEELINLHGEDSLIEWSGGIIRVKSEVGAANG